MISRSQAEATWRLSLANGDNGLQIFSYSAVISRTSSVFE
jgi:hypothetical protein